MDKRIMPRPDNLPEIIEQREAGETCSQFVFGADEYYLGIALDKLVKTGSYRYVGVKRCFNSKRR